MFWFIPSQVCGWFRSAVGQASRSELGPRVRADEAGGDSEDADAGRDGGAVIMIPGGWQCGVWSRWKKSWSGTLIFAGDQQDSLVMWVGDK